MGSVGDSYDNALMENFWSTLKIELVHRTSWRTRDEAENAIFTYIDTWYNTRRIQKELGYLSPTSTKPPRTPRRRPRTSQISSSMHQPAAGNHRSIKAGKAHSCQAEVALRPVDGSDLDALFEQMRDPASVRMAAFTAEDPDDRTAFDVHMAKVRTSPEVTNRAITVDGRLIGSITSFVIEGDTEVTYWIDRSCWGQGIASRALALLLELVPARPLFARVASDNVGSLKVLQKAGFAITGTEISFANGRNSEIEETILRLDKPSDTSPSDVSSRVGPEWGRLTDLGSSGCRVARGADRAVRDGWSLGGRTDGG